jgi:hypothetical protein
MLSRFRAFAIHLIGSALLASLGIALAFFVWYPSPLASAVGLFDFFYVIVGVDVVLGPLLTFIVFKPGKKSLRFDLAVILLLQLGVFSYGIYTIAAARPAWIVFNADRFDVALAHELDPRSLKTALDEYRSPSWSGPRWVASANPADSDRRNTLVIEAAMGGPDLPQRPDLYVALNTQAENIKSRAKPLKELRDFNSVAAVQEAIGRWPEADSWLPLMARARPMVVLLRKADARVLAIADLRPWAP